MLALMRCGFSEESALSMPEAAASTYLELMAEIHNGKPGAGGKGKGKKSVVKRNDR